MDFPLISDRIAVSAAKALDNLVPKKSKDAYDKENKRLFEKDFQVDFCNLRGLNSNLNSIHQHLQDENPHILALTESQIKSFSNDSHNCSCLVWEAADGIVKTFLKSRNKEKGNIMMADFKRIHSLGASVFPEPWSLENYNTL